MDVSVVQDFSSMCAAPVWLSVSAFDVDVDVGHGSLAGLHLHGKERWRLLERPTCLNACTWRFMLTLIQLQKSEGCTLN